MRNEMVEEYQILFDMESLSENSSVSESNLIKCDSSIGEIKNIIGKTLLYCKQVYSFSFWIVNCAICLIGVVDEEGANEIRQKGNKKSFSTTAEGYALHSDGYTRNN